MSKELRPIEQKTYEQLGQRRLFAKPVEATPGEPAVTAATPEAAAAVPAAPVERVSPLEPIEPLSRQLDLWVAHGNGEDIPAKVAAVRAMKQQRLKPGAIDKFATEAARLEARNEAERRSQIGYTGRALILAGLPHSDPGDVSVWTRHNGGVTLQVEPRTFVFHDGSKQSFGIPYGTIPRLLMPLIDSEILRTKDSSDHRVYLGDTITEMHRMLVSQGGGSRAVRLRGGKRGDYARYEEQTRRLATARFTLHYHDKRGLGFRDVQLAKAGFLCWSPLDPDKPLFQDCLVPSEDYVREVIAHPVPIDMGALLLFSQSPLQMDVFEWLCWKFSTLERPVFIPWANLKLQFGAGYTSQRRFAQQLRAAISVVCGVYTKARVFPEPGGLKLLPSPTFVPRSTRRRAPVSPGAETRTLGP